ncbi:MAG: nucleotidyltransferase family protein [Synergistota bacterium]|nr:nucleotidyltransferase family protein [Synergistota bacterium]
MVAEYNPLHNGHAHHINRARELAGADGAVVAILSSYFTQRGEPALLSPWDRAESALSAGANLVLGLPAFFSCHNAGVFASGAVDTLAATGVVGSLSFGMEDPDFDVSSLIDILVHEPVTFKDTLKKHLNSGFSYVKARAKALGTIDPAYERVVSSPNNSLALAYMERIRRMGHKLNCFPVRRTGGGYHDPSLPSEPKDGFFASATAIRRGIAEKGLEHISSAVPPGSLEVLERCMADGRFVPSTELLWRTVRALVLRTPAADLARYSEMGEGMENRLLKFAEDSRTWEEFIGKCVTGRYPRGRVQRQAIHLLLGVEHDDNRALQANGPAYIRPLAADGAGLEILRRMRKSASLPVRGKLPAARRGAEGLLARIELVAAGIWEGLTPSFQAGSEKRRCFFTARECEGEETSP